MSDTFHKGLYARLRYYHLEAVNAKTISTVDGLVEQFSNVFSDSLGTMKGALAMLTLQEGARKEFFKA